MPFGIATPVLLAGALFGPSYAIVTHDCAPWDGAATTFLLSDRPMKGAHPEPPWRRITIYQSLPSVLGHAFDVTQLTTQVGIGHECKRNGDCRGADSASIRFGPAQPDKTVEVTYRFDFGKGDIVAGTVRAELRLERTMCG